MTHSPGSGGLSLASGCFPHGAAFAKRSHLSKRTRWEDTKATLCDGLGHEEHKDVQTDEHPGWQLVGARQTGG